MKSTIAIVLLIVAVTAVGYLAGVRKGGDLAFDFYPYIQIIPDTFVEYNNYKRLKKKYPDHRPSLYLEGKIDSALVSWSLLKDKEREFLYKMCCDFSYRDQARKFMPELVRYRESVSTLLGTKFSKESIERLEPIWQEQARINGDQQLLLIEETMKEFE